MLTNIIQNIHTYIHMLYHSTEQRNIYLTSDLVKTYANPKNKSRKKQEKQLQKNMQLTSEFFAQINKQKTAAKRPNS